MCYDTLFSGATFVLGKCRNDRCTVNGILKIEEHLRSENRVFSLILNETGNLEIWCKEEKLWTTNTNDKYVNFSIFNNDGKMYMLGKDNSSRWNTGATFTNSKPDFILMQNDGNLVVYDTGGVMHWESKTKEKCISIPGKYFFLKK